MSGHAAAQPADAERRRTNRRRLGERIAARQAVYRLRRLLSRFQWLHQIIGVIGGFTFFTGSIFFLLGDAWRVGAAWLFIIGSAGMLIGNLGNVIVRYRIDRSEHRESVQHLGPTEPIG